jgi:hypothetical protein
MKIAQIEENLHKVVKPLKKESFIYDLLLSYGLPKASITRLRKGNLNLSKNNGEISWKKKVLFREVLEGDLHLAISNMQDEAKHDQRFIVATDWETLLAIDSKTDEKLDIELKDLPKYYDFFLPWAGMEKHQHQGENPADVKAAVKMAKLFDEIKKNNPDNSPEAIHNLNIFLSRLLFCFFAEDTNIFSEHQFTKAIGSHTNQDGSDLNDYLNKLFDVLDTPKEKRQNLPEFLNAFPYANGGLFDKTEKIKAPKFTRKSRQAIIDSGELNWAAINPDIFGSMFQAVISEDQRGNLGQHYTSVTNIMKVIEPLFLNDLKEELEKAKGNEKKLKKLLNRLRHIKIFDPACGSGNFLIIAYKELRKLEIEIFKEIDLVNRTYSNQFSLISLNNFYGIELDDFAHEISKLALWLAEHQMNMEFYNAFGKTNPTLPLKDAGQITRGNACNIDWNEICSLTQSDEMYVLGNPPYQGYAKQSSYQKTDMKNVFEGISDYKKLDYIACWFYKTAKYISKSNSKFAFLTTNSVTQGEQVSLLWPLLFKLELEIGFAYQSFKWKNNAKSNAGVSVVIIGVQGITNNKKNIFLNYKGKYFKTDKISPYLTADSETIIKPRLKPLSDLPIMIKGSSPGDNKNLILSEQEKKSILNKYPKAKRFIKLYLGAKEFMHNEKRYCIWVKEDEVSLAKTIPEFLDRFENVKKFRLSSSKKATQKKASIPYLFDERKFNETNSILVPQTGSERREYLPIGYCNKDVIISNAARVLYNAEPWIFSLLSSKLHIVWVKAVAGRLKMDMQYSNTLCYNTFPVPNISNNKKKALIQSGLRIIDVREKYSEKTMSELYDPHKMPNELKEVHKLNDTAVDQCYRTTPFNGDEQRLEYLFKLYEKMIAEEKERKTLFEKQKKSRKRKKKNA